MKILLTGAAGLIGSHLVSRLSRDHEVVALKHPDLDITDRHAVNRIVMRVRPSLVINCAVMQVDESEQNPATAHGVNAEAPGFLAHAATSVDAETVQFSTQYAFSGEPPGRMAYTVADEPAPVNVYGATKVAGEFAVRQGCARSYIIRTSWVYGRGKNSFLCTVDRDLKSGRRVRAIDDIWSSTTYVADLIERCLEILAGGLHGTYHIVNEGVCSYYDFACEAGRLIGLTREQVNAAIEIVHERDMERSAVRPRYTPLRCLLSEELGFASMRDWKSALRAYVKSDSDSED